MTPNVPVVHTIKALRGQVAAWRRLGERIALVPTMGALHAGHLSLVEAARRRAQRVVVTIFVNPAQFGPSEDFAKYPRTLPSDLERLESVAADLCFAPPVEEIYPQGFATRIEMDGPARADLEDRFRPAHFSGVATVVAKLLIAAMPDVAIFGEKDYQQLLVIRRLTVDLGLPIEILGGPIIREADGLAMSSRNAYLTPEQRKIAGRLNIVLRDAITRLKHGDPVAVAEQFGRSDLLEAGFDSVDYVAIRDAATLETIETPDRPARILAAAKIGGTRLIDNMAVN